MVHNYKRKSPSRDYDEEMTKDYASVAAMSGGPRSSPRQTLRLRGQLGPGKS
jgi:hypothetical protein